MQTSPLNILHQLQDIKTYKVIITKQDTVILEQEISISKMIQNQTLNIEQRLAYALRAIVFKDKNIENALNNIVQREQHHKITDKQSKQLKKQEDEKLLVKEQIDDNNIQKDIITKKKKKNKSKKSVPDESKERKTQNVIQSIIQIQIKPTDSMTLCMMSQRDGKQSDLSKLNKLLKKPKAQSLDITTITQRLSNLDLLAQLRQSKMFLQ